MGRERLFITRCRVGDRRNVVERLDSLILGLGAVSVLGMLSMLGILVMFDMLGMDCVVGMDDIYFVHSLKSEMKAFVVSLIIISAQSKDRTVGQ